MKHHCLAGDIGKAERVCGQFQEQSEQLVEICKMLNQVAPTHKMKITTKTLAIWFELNLVQLLSIALCLAQNPRSKVAKDCTWAYIQGKLACLRVFVFVFVFVFLCCVGLALVWPTRAVNVMLRPPVEGFQKLRLTVFFPANNLLPLKPNLISPQVTLTNSLLTFSMCAVSLNWPNCRLIYLTLPVSPTHFLSRSSPNVLCSTYENTQKRQRPY